VTQRRTMVSPWRMHFTYCSMQKGTSWAKVMLNSEKIKSIVLAVILVVWKHQLVSKSVSGKFLLNQKKITATFMKAFQADLKASFTNQYCPITVGENWGFFGVILFCGSCLLLCRPYYEPLAWFMIICHISWVHNVNIRELFFTLLKL